jgi:glycosyltransferase involved in cell wall biosynthesis
VSEGVADDVSAITRLDREKLHVIYNPVDMLTIETQAAEPVEHPWFALGEPPVVLSAGRLEPAKDFSTLVRAFAIVRERTEARLMILGEGAQRDALEGFAEALGIRENVTFPGFLANPYAYMARSNVFVLSSRWEGFGMVIVEAMACGTPIVATDCCNGPSEILENGRWGNLAGVGSSEELASGIIQKLEDAGPDPRSRAHYFCVERALQGYLGVINKLHGGS